MAQELKHPNGNTKAKFFKRLEKGECECKYDNNTYIIEDGIVYKRV